MSKQLASETCPVCKGEGSLRCTIHDDHQFECPECGGVGVVPAAGDLAQWREEAERIVQELATAIIAPPKPLDLGHLIIGGLTMILRHLAAMPAQAPNAELLAALRSIGQEKCYCYEYDGDYCSHEIALIGLGSTRPELLAAIAQAEKGAAK